MRAKCSYAWRSIPATLKATLTDLMQVGTQRAASAEYARFFGRYNAESFKEVARCLETMLFRVMSDTMWLYYRGQSVAPNDTYSDWPYVFGETTGLGAEDNGGATISPAQRKAGGLRTHRHVEQTDACIHIKLGKQVEGQSEPGAPHHP